MIEEKDLQFEKVSHVSYRKEYVTSYRDNTYNVEKEVTVKRTFGGYGVGASKTRYYIGDNKKVYNSISEVLKQLNNGKTS